jgi:hypothetical protein
VEGRKAGDLEMLLTFFIELNPSVPVFTDLLARYAVDPRPGMAEAAGILQRSWLRGRAASTTEPMPPLAEVLRTVGALLDEGSTRAAYIVTAPDCVQVQTFGDLSQLRLGPREFQQEIAARAALRGQADTGQAEPIERYEARLRAVGSVLDEQPPQSFAVVTTRRSAVVEGTEGYYRIFTNDDIATLLAASSGHGQEET